jgi:hypothetical protein
MMLRFLFLCAISACLYASSINVYLELVLSRSGTLIDGATDITVSLVGPSGDYRWGETHRSVHVFDGVAAFKIGNITPIKPHYFYDQGVELLVTIAEESISLPMRSTPFSLFSHSADVVNAIHMEGVFHTDLINKRIGIGIDHPTPSVLLEVNGALRVSDNVFVDEIGAIRWRNFRLEGRHNHQWELLDIGPQDDLETKWEKSPAVDGFYSLQPVAIVSEHPSAMLTVSGNVYVDQDVAVGGQLSALGRLSLPNNYGVSNNGGVTARSLYLDSDNRLNVTDGLMVSGQLMGNGAGVSGIGSQHIRSNAVQGHELMPSAIASINVLDGAITNDKLMPNSITKRTLSDTFELLNEHFLLGVIDAQKIQPYSIGQNDLSPTFELSAFHFSDGIIVSQNIGNGYLDASILGNAELAVSDVNGAVIDDSRLLDDGAMHEHHIRDGTILAEDFAPGSLGFSHIDAPFGMAIGGTGQTDYGTINGQLMMVSDNRVETVPMALTSKGLGIHTATPMALLHVMAVSEQPAVLIEAVDPTTSLSNGIHFKNQSGRWFIGVTPTGNFALQNELNLERVLAMNNSNGHLGIGQEPGIERLSIHGGVVLGDDAQTAEVPPGSVYFSADDEQFKWVTDTDTLVIPQLLDGAVSQSEFFTDDIHNASTDSWVLLGQGIDASGSNHVVMGASESSIAGHGHVLMGGHQLGVSGDNHHVVQSVSTAVEGKNATIQLAHNTHIAGSDHLGEQLHGARINGHGHGLFQIQNSHVDGQSNHVSFASNARVNGLNHGVHHAHLVDVDGNYHQVGFSDSMVVHGHQNHLSHATKGVLNGTQNMVAQSNNITVVGNKNHVANASSAVVMGDANQWVQSSGWVVGSNNRHLGSGVPTIVGNGNSIIGHSNAAIRANHVVAMGTSRQGIGTDESIHFFAPGGVDIVSGDTALAVLAPNAGSWSHVSDRAVKTNVRAIDPLKVLHQVAQLPMSEWSYKGQNYVRHIGPMAQDFYQMFELGSSDRYIQTVDMDGIIFSAIQGLGKRYTQVNYIHQHVTKQHQNLATNNQVIQHSVDALLASANALVPHHHALNDQFDELHKNERDQSMAIDHLGQRLNQLQQQFLEQP